MNTFLIKSNLSEKRRRFELNRFTERIKKKHNINE